MNTTQKVHTKKVFITKIKIKCRIATVSRHMLKQFSVDQFLELQICYKKSPLESQRIL